MVYGVTFVEVVNRPGFIGDFVYIYRRDVMTSKISVDFMKEGKVVETKLYGPGEEFPPVMYLDREDAAKLVSALLKRGVKLPEKAYTEGKLEATESHLRDMRRLAFEVPGKEYVEDEERSPR